MHKDLGRGTPSLPCFFVIAMDVMSMIIDKVVTEGVVSLFTGISSMQHLSFYADDIALFVRPMEGDLSFVRCALQAFGNVSGLRVNYCKSSAILISESDLDQQRVATMLQCNIGAFPCKYLGLQLAINQLSRSYWPLIRLYHIYNF